MPKRPKVYLFDTVTLSNFALAGRFELLIERYGHKLLLTSEVLDELAEGVNAGNTRLSQVEEAVDKGLIKRTKETIPPSTRQTYRELLRMLGPGEASCIARGICLEAVVVSDDRIARRCCAEKQIAVTGTIGILKACCMDGTLTENEADDLLRAMISAGFYSPIQSISEDPKG